MLVIIAPRIRIRLFITGIDLSIVYLDKGPPVFVVIIGVSEVPPGIIQDPKRDVGQTVFGKVPVQVAVPVEPDSDYAALKHIRKFGTLLQFSLSSRFNTFSASFE